MSRLSAFFRGALSIFDFEFDISGQSTPPEICDPVEPIVPLKFPRRLMFFSFPKTVEEAWARDAAAIASDWQKVGNDLRKAMGQHEQTAR